MIKLLKHLLHFLGFIDCVHEYSNWEEETVRSLQDRTIYDNVLTGYQHRKCSKCGFNDKRWI